VTAAKITGGKQEHGQQQDASGVYSHSNGDMQSERWDSDQSHDMTHIGEWMKLVARGNGRQHTQGKGEYRKMRRTFSEGQPGRH